MKALIIGAAGFVGNYLINVVREQMLCDVYATKLPSDRVTRNDITFLDLNITNADEVNNLMEQVEPDYVFHLAAQSSVSRSWKEPALTVEVNVKGALNILDAARRLEQPPRILMVGSGEEYGTISPDMIPIREESLLNPLNIYAATKACQNMITSIYSTAYGMQVIMTRSFNHMGAGQANGFVVSDFCYQVARIECGKQPPVIRVGNLQAKRDFTDVKDVVRAYVDLMNFGVSGQVYNVGSGHAISIQSILDMILSKSLCKIDVIIDPAKLRPIDVPIIEADISKIRAETGWEPSIPLSDTIDDMLNYWRKACAEE